MGLPDRDAALLVAGERPGSHSCRASTRRVRGLVTLPGAFVGTLLGGASPLQAAALQLVVLVGILLVQTVAVAVTLELVVLEALSC